MMDLAPELPNIDFASFESPDKANFPPLATTKPSRFLLLYGSLHERSFSRMVIEEAARILRAFGADVRIFNPKGLPLVEDTASDHPKVEELRALVKWADGMVWSSPELHGSMTGLMKTQIDWIPFSEEGVSPTSGKMLAVMQVTGGGQSFNAVNHMRVVARWMHLVAIPHQICVARAYQEFTDTGRMKPSAQYDRIVDVMEELMKYTLLTRDAKPYLADRYSERKELAFCPE